jgi:hypothetical protein
LGWCCDGQGWQALREHLLVVPTGPGREDRERKRLLRHTDIQRLLDKNCAESMRHSKCRSVRRDRIASRRRDLSGRFRPRGVARWISCPAADLTLRLLLDNAGWWRRPNKRPPQPACASRLTHVWPSRQVQDSMPSFEPLSLERSGRALSQGADRQRQAAGVKSARIFVGTPADRRSALPRLNDRFGAVAMTPQGRFAPFV